jgi:hypothetical protein
MMMSLSVSSFVSLETDLVQKKSVTVVNRRRKRGKQYLTLLQHIQQVRVKLISVLVQESSGTVNYIYDVELDPFYWKAEQD